jgi:GAF domain-containing protein
LKARIVDDDISVALAEAARTIGQASTQEETLRAIVETARGSIPGFDHVGVSTIDKRGRVHTRATTSDLVRELDALQYGLQEGPCVDSLHEANMVSAPDIRHDQRWPTYVPAAVKLGLRSQLAVKLFLDEEGTVGGLNLYSTISSEIDPAAAVAADLFASQAVAVLEKTRELDDLHAALLTREQIGQAVGLVMAQYHVTSQSAFTFLARTSSHSNIKLRDIAERVIADHNEKLRPQ